MSEINTEKKVTIYQIAQEAGVSASQVSRAISGKGYVSEENRKKIQALVEKYNYRPNALAQNLQKGKSNTIGFLIPHIYEEYFPMIYSSFEREMTEKGYVTIVFNGKSTFEEEIRILHILEDTRVDAAVIIGGSLDFADWNLRKEYISTIRNLSAKIPCVLGNERAGQLGCSGVFVNLDKGLKELTDYIASKGYKTMGILGGFDSVYPSLRLRNTLREYATQKGILIKPEWEVRSSYNARDGAAAMKELLKNKKLPEIVCCINDEIAVGAMGVALDKGFNIPKDIAFTGFDGVYLSQEFRPQLTTLQMDFETMGKELARIVEDHLNGKREIKDIAVDPWLEIRSST